MDQSRPKILKGPNQTDIYRNRPNGQKWTEWTVVDWKDRVRQTWTVQTEID